MDNLPKKRGRKVGSSVVTLVELAELNKIFQPSMMIPVSTKFVQFLIEITSGEAAKVEEEPAPPENSLTPAEEPAIIQVKEENWE